MGRAARLRSERLAEKLREIRSALGLSQNELIRHLGLEDVIYHATNQASVNLPCLFS
jgi:transcriptional regulator with XRE-family HTH domain